MLRVVTLDVERSSVTAQYLAFLCLQLMGSWEHNKKLTEFPFILAEVIFLHLSLHVRFAACFVLFYSQFLLWTLTVKGQ
jgi:hypothetical protein